MNPLKKNVPALSGPPGASSVVPKVALPMLVEHGGVAAKTAWRDFFSGKLPNDGTRAAYTHAIRRFLRWCEGKGIRELHRITPGDLGEYFRAHPGALPTKKQHLSGIRKFWNLLVERHLCLLNPAAAVELERYSVVEGKTPLITQVELDRLVESIGAATVVALRDRAIIATLSFTGVRAGAIAKLRRNDLYEAEGQWMLHFSEKRGKSRELPVRHDLQAILFQYLDEAEMRDAEMESPLFRSAIRRENRLTDRGMTPNDVCRMIKRRMRKASLPEKLSAHSFRVAVATDLFGQGVETAEIQYLLGHSDSRTTGLYDRTLKKVTRNLVERIRIAIADGQSV
jgi:site-specific recombinase XerD